MRYAGWGAFWIVLLGVTALHLRTQGKMRQTLIRQPGAYVRGVLESTNDVAVPQEAQVLEAENAEIISTKPGTSPAWQTIERSNYSGGKARLSKQGGDTLRWPVQLAPGDYRVFVDVNVYPHGGRNEADVRLGDVTQRITWRVSPMGGSRFVIANITLSTPSTEASVCVIKSRQPCVLVDRVVIARATEPASAPDKAGEGLVGLYLGVVGTAITILVAALCWGSLLVRRWTTGGIDATSALVIAVTLGLGILGTAVTLLGMTGWYDASMVWALLFIGAAAGYRPAIRLLARWRRETQLFRERRFTAVTGALCAVAAFASVAALAPAVGVDPLYYHLSIAKWLIRDGGFTYHPMHLASAFPHLVSNLYAVSLTLCDDHLFRPAVMIHAMLGWLWLAAVYALGKTMFGRWAGVGAVVLCLGIEGVIYEFGLALADFGMALFSTSAAAAFVIWWQRSDGGERSWRMAALAAALAGFAAVCKVNGPATAIALGVCFGAAAWSRWGFVAGLKHFVLIGAVSLLVASPMYLKNYHLYGNPIYPFGTYFANRDLNGNYGAMFGNGSWSTYVHEKGPRVVVQWAFDWIRKCGPDWFSPGPGFLCAFLLAISSGRRWWRAWWPVYMFILMAVIMWLAVSPLTRFGWSWLGVASVLACAPLSETPRSRWRMAASLLVVVSALLPMIGELYLPLATVNVVRGSANIPAYLARLEDYHAGTGLGPPLVGIERMNEMFRAEPWKGRTLIDTNMMAHADFPTVPANYYLIVQAAERKAWARTDGPPCLAFSGKVVDDAAMWRELRERMDIDHILMKKNMGVPAAGSDGRYHFGEVPETSFGEEDRFEVFMDRWVREGRAIRIDLGDSVMYALRERASP
ncbi:MAG: hypothetical protein HZA51_00950 [Planctomycetes bacterium]|nr:hypothetical protein [Planctomycetota bacterium]